MFMPTSEEIRAEMESMPGLGEMQAYRRLQDREHVRRRLYSHQSFTPIVGRKA